jgi:cytochrome c-type biogenesis protein CcmH/NrfG
MVARRIDIKSRNGGDDLLTEGGIRSKETKKYSTAMYWVIAITVGLLLYHCYGTYVEQVGLEEAERNEAMDCMYQFKTQDCNPLNMSDKCKEIYACIEKAPQDIDELSMMAETVKRVSQNMSDTMLGPVAMIALVILLTYIR